MLYEIEDMRKERDKMKSGKIHLFLFVLIALVVVNVQAQKELPQLAEKPLLVDNPYPALLGVDELYVQIIKTSMAKDVTGINWEELRLGIEKKLREEGINYVEPKLSPIPRVKVFIHFLEIPDSNEFVSYIQTSLARLVTLKDGQKTNMLVDVWKTNPVMQIIPVEGIQAKIADVTLEQIEIFIHAYKTANAQNTLLNKADMDKNSPLKGPDKSEQPTIEKLTSRYSYVASKYSSVFHKPGCRWAQNISEENLVGYNSRDEAIKAGKRPCKSCNP
jgi:hypothetical protein